MKILILVILLFASGTIYAQADRIVQDDSLKSGRKTNLFTINSRHNYNTVQFDSLASTDSIKAGITQKQVKNIL